MIGYITNHVILMGMNRQEKYGTSMDLFAVDSGMSGM